MTTGVNLFSAPVISVRAGANVREGARRRAPGGIVAPNFSRETLVFIMETRAADVGFHKPGEFIRTMRRPPRPEARQNYVSRLGDKEPIEAVKFVTRLRLKFGQCTRREVGFRQEVT